MKAEIGERRRWLCELAAHEQDPEKLMKLIEVNQLRESNTGGIEQVVRTGIWR